MHFFILFITKFGGDICPPNANCVTVKNYVNRVTIRLSPNIKVITNVDVSKSTF